MIKTCAEKYAVHYFIVIIGRVLCYLQKVGWIVDISLSTSNP